MPEKGELIKVHDHGYVRLCDWFGSDMEIVEAARVSYKSKGKTKEEDVKLLKRLFKDKHTTPFEMAKIKFQMRVPIFVMRQYIRHRMQNINEESARYRQLRDDFYVPDFFRLQGDGKNKQGSGEFLNDNYNAAYRELLKETYKATYMTYEAMLKAGIAREQARMILPVGIYTEFYCCWDMHNFLKYMILREDSHAQSEHRDYAMVMKHFACQVFPEVMNIYQSWQDAKTSLPKKLRQLILDHVASQDADVTEEEISQVLYSF